MKRRILVVDDELSILLTLKAVLEINGFEVETASSAREAVRKLEASVFQMVITDLKMEHETAGYDVVRAANKLADPPVTAILTAFASLGSAWKSEGAQSLFVKPMNTPDLLRSIEALLIAQEDRKSRSVAGAV